MRKIIYLLFILFLLSTVNAANDSMSSEDKCEETGVYCDCDVNCDFQEVCITRETDDALKSFCFNPTYKINKALAAGSQGFCAKLYTRTMLPDATVYDKIRTEATLYCEKEDLENYVEATCPVCVNNTEYVNVLVPEPYPVVDDEYENKLERILFAGSFMLSGLILCLIFYYRKVNELVKPKFTKELYGDEK